jgi:DNA-binding transcriptional LysR family regulator
MDIRQMSQVVAIAQHGSFGKAAGEIGISQPTLSKSIARLEDELGFKLFDRSGWRAQLTPLGAFVVDRAERLIAQSRRFEREIDLFALGEFGEVRIGLGPVLREEFMPRLAAEIVRRHPSLQPTLLSEGRTSLLQGLAAGAYDLLFVAQGDDLAERGLLSMEVMRDPAVAVASPSHPLAGCDRIALREFLQHPVAASARSASAAPAIFPLPHLSAPADFRPTVVANDIRTSITLAQQGFCTYVGSGHLLRAALESGQLVRLDLDFTYEFHTVAVMTPAAAHSPLLNRIVAYAQEIGARLTAPAATPARSGASALDHAAAIG